jgi:isocitrate dehydrogenase
LFHKVFDEVAAEYPDIQNETWIVDIGAAKLADQPENFDVIVMPNLYGDILSDVAAQIAGSVGLAGSANIGDQCAMFEAIHGSAPRRAGRNLANPSGLLLAAVMMLNHIGQNEVATRVHNAWLKTIEDGIHTYDIFKEGVSQRKVGTAEFADAVVHRLGERPGVLRSVSYKASKPMTLWRKNDHRPKAEKHLVGVDVFLDWEKGSPNDLGSTLGQVSAGRLQLRVITNRGITVWPDGLPETFCTDHWRCRFLSNGGEVVSPGEVVELLRHVTEAGFDNIKTENLYLFDGVPGFSAVHGSFSHDKSDLAHPVAPLGTNLPGPAGPRSETRPVTAGAHDEE